MKDKPKKPKKAAAPAKKKFKGPLTIRERELRKKNKRKRFRIVLQILLGVCIVLILLRYVIFPERYVPAFSASADGPEYQGTLGTDTSDFISISYAGLDTDDSLESRIVSQRAFQEQLEALHASGYVTITQDDILSYYANHTPLPAKSLYLIFEDGIMDTATLAQSTLQKYNYKATMCTYAANLTDTNSKFVTTSDIQKLMGNSYWELGSNGYRLSYINVFDLYGNFFDQLNTNEFVTINQYLKRDYNHYLMDFIRDSDRLRVETVDEMDRRLEYDYDQMQLVYSAEAGYVPHMYILMHSNTGAFGNDTLVSQKNGELLTGLFQMNFNRQGSCLNNRESSLYDLSRLQAQAYFSTNHLLMRIQDDTGDSVAFVTGDENEAQNWYIDQGVAEFRKNEIILTTDPYAEGQMVLSTGLLSDFDMTVDLKGNKIGIQSIYLRTNRDFRNGVQVSLENNNLVVRSLSSGDSELFRLDLFEFDGGPTQSKQEHEHEGLVAYYETIIRYDEDAERIAHAHECLAELAETWPISIADGGTPYVPELDIAERDSRNLRIRMVGSRLNIWLDGRLVVEDMHVDTQSRGNIAFGAGVWKNEEDHYSQSNLYDDVYDAVFTDPLVTSVDDPSIVYYSYRLSGIQQVQKLLTDVADAITEFFLSRF